MTLPLQTLTSLTRQQLGDVFKDPRTLLAFERIQLQVAQIIPATFTAFQNLDFVVTVADPSIPNAHVITEGANIDVASAAGLVTITATPSGASGQIQYNNGGTFGAFTTSGDATINTGTGVLTLATVNANVGTFGDSTHVSRVTLNAKGLATAASSVAIVGLAPVAGGTGQVLTKNSTADYDYSWQTPVVSGGTVTHTAGALTSGQLVFGNGLADIKVGDLSGDVSTSGSGVTTIGALKVATGMLQAGAVTLAKIADAAASNRYLGAGSAGSGAAYTENTFTAGTGIAITNGLSGITITATGGGSTTSPTYIVGDFSKWTAAKARGSLNPARIAIIGDSNVSGQGSGSGANNLTGAWTTGFAHAFAASGSFLNNSFFGDQNVPAQGTALGTYDTRMTLGSGWTSDTSGNQSLGGRMLVAPQGSAGKLKFTPASAFTKFRLWYPTASGICSSFTVSVDGTLVDTFSQSAANSYAHKDYTVSNTTHFIEFGVGGTGQGYVAGVETSNGTTTPVFHQLGSCGMLSAELALTANPWSTQNAAVAGVYDYLIVYCDINDVTNATALSTYYANIEAFVSANASTANGCLLVCYPSNKVGTTNGYLDQLYTILRSLAVDYNWSFYDLRANLGHSNTKTSALGYRYDDLHPDLAGHTVIASALYSFLSANGL